MKVARINSHEVVSFKSVYKLHCDQEEFYISDGVFASRELTDLALAKLKEMNLNPERTLHSYVIKGSNNLKGKIAYLRDVDAIIHRSDNPIKIQHASDEVVLEKIYNLL